MSEPGHSVDIRNTGEYVKLRNKYTQLKMDHATLATEAEKLRGDMQARDAELTRLRTEADQNQLLKDNRTLKDQLRGERHWRVIDGQLRAAGIRPEAIEAFRKLVPYDAKGDEPDMEAVKAFVETGKQTHAYLFNGQTPEAEKDQPKPGPAGGQGGRDTSGGKFRATVAQQGDPEWLAANYEKRQQAIRDGTFELID